ncbi:uncharacterized protein DUF1579 [Flavobacterium endophyticum]|uniref:Uncharacterized protein DUF1579 n=1 Tax=Flavobacterium endophyticum TaxID=1540163 RepID=A0A495MJJ8_9FLAO|nr:MULTISPECIES: DUF1579 domain-containing protein [Flavobacterium]RKS25023.1 uncharacterized protein DUF1579 [Flavobacterium endophyticum]WDO12483.1 DUF1579 domain-containing protein [Flavobacterium sp. WW92]
MKTNYIYLGALLLCLTACKKEVKVEEKVVVEKDSVPAEVVKSEPMDSIAMQKAWEEYMTPSEMHKKMAADTGTWEEELTFWMGPDDTKPQKSTATANTKMILNGLYQESVHTGNMMGMPFEGRSTLAYDNAAKQYVSTWIDNMGSGIMVMRGNYDEASKTVKMEGEVTDPMTKKVKKIREVITAIDANTQKMEMYDMSPDGKEFKSMEIMMKRKK